MVGEKKIDSIYLVFLCCIIAGVILWPILNGRLKMTLSGDELLLAVSIVSVILTTSVQKHINRKKGDYIIALNSMNRFLSYSWAFFVTVVLIAAVYLQNPTIVRAFLLLFIFMGHIFMAVQKQGIRKNGIDIGVFHKWNKIKSFNWDEQDRKFSFIIKDTDLRQTASWEFQEEDRYKIEMLLNENIKNE